MGLSGGERQAVAPLRTPSFPGFVPKIRPNRLTDIGLQESGVGLASAEPSHVLLVVRPLPATSTPTTTTSTTAHSPKATGAGHTRTTAPPSASTTTYLYFARWCRLADSRTACARRIARRLKQYVAPTA